MILNSGFDSTITFFFVLSASKCIEEDAEEWVMAQIVEQEIKENNTTEDEAKDGWEPPPISWNKCNIGVVWFKKKQVAEIGWVLRNEEGVVLLHSRQAFTGVESKGEAYLKTFS
ncbi:hypothetical protein V5N11_028409 [Cardamine amara subsp. amara]|uniref:Uncharacterized protein n=1 Tax=Cardamine amara subsp. amara TaxID=228776 RepID=A0ABD1A7L8_CARAN